MGNNVEWNNVDCATVSNKFSSVNSVDFLGVQFKWAHGVGFRVEGLGLFEISKHPEVL
jgi:hypothetical protein